MRDPRLLPLVRKGLLAAGSGSSWTAANVPAPGNAASADTNQFALAVACPSATECVAVGSYVIENNYDLMVKYATAIRLGTGSTEALMRRFTSETTHPAYAAMLKVGRAQRTIFLARWLRDRDLQRETESGLNGVENYNGVNDYVRFGRRGGLAGAVPAPA